MAVWCGSTEVYRKPAEVHSTLAKFEDGLRTSHDAIAPSQIYAWVGVVFAVVMLGGLGSALGPLIAGIVIGVSEAMTMALTAPSWAPLVSFSLLIALLVLRPEKL